MQWSHQISPPTNDGWTRTRVGGVSDCGSCSSPFFRVHVLPVVAVVGVLVGRGLGILWVEFLEVRLCEWCPPSCSPSDTPGKYPCRYFPCNKKFSTSSNRSRHERGHLQDSSVLLKEDSQRSFLCKLLAPLLDSGIAVASVVPLCPLFCRPLSPFVN